MNRYKYYFFDIVLSFLRNLQSIRWGTVTFRNQTRFLYRNLMDLYVLTESYLNHDYQKYGCPLGQGWTIVDIGAGIGDFTVLAAQTSPRNRIFAFEPNPESFRLLRRNIGLNHLQNVRPYALAVSETAATLSLTVNSTNQGNSRTDIPQLNSVRVDTISLGQLIKDHRLETIDLIKCDCEGYEYPILLNLKPSVYHHIKRLIIEYHLFQPSHPHQLALVQTKLHRLGFQVKLTPNPVSPHLGFLFARQ